MQKESLLTVLLGLGRGVLVLLTTVYNRYSKVEATSFYCHSLKAV